MPIEMAKPVCAEAVPIAATPSTKTAASKARCRFICYFLVLVSTIQQRSIDSVR
jgi:hypothetical protein